MVTSGQKAVTTAGTAVVLGTEVIQGGLMVKALAANTGLVFIGNDGADDVAAANGMQLTAKEEIVFPWISGLENLWIDSAVNGEGVAWIRLTP